MVLIACGHQTPGQSIDVRGCGVSKKPLSGKMADTDLVRTVFRGNWYILTVHDANPTAPEE